MSYSNQAAQSYLRNAVLTATQEQLHLMLIDGAIRFTTQGRDALQRDALEPAFNALERAQKIMIELINGLKRDTNPELVDRMAGLYGFIYRRIVEANSSRQLKPLDEALHFLREQRSTWQLLMERISKEVPESARNAANKPTEEALSLQG